MELKKSLLSILTSATLVSTIPTFSESTPINKPILKTEEVIDSLCYFISIPLKKLRELNYEHNLKHIKNSNGDDWFDFYDIEYFSDLNIPLSYIETASSYLNKERNPAYTGSEIINIYKRGISESFLEKILITFSKEQKKFPNPLVISHYEKISDEPSTLFPKNTSKPNAILVLSEELFPKNAFYNEHAINFYNKIRENYDSYTQVASSTQELCDILVDSYERNFNPDLLIISGHGDKSGYLSLSSKPLFLKLIISPESSFFISKENNECYFSNEDANVGQYISFMKSNSTIFFLSCYGGTNFKEFSKKYAPESRFIGASDVFEIKDIIINSVYPLDLSIRNPEGKDVTIKEDNFSIFGSKPLKKN